MEDLIQRAAEDLVKAKAAAALTGAGISVESGIPPFRGPGGVWEKIDPMEYASIDAFMRDPAKVWNVLLKDMKKLLDTARPNPAHEGLARLERLGLLKTVITQNVDGLHQAAGNTDVVEFHGTFASHRCIECNRREEASAIDLGRIPPLCSCGGIWRPECVFFGEMIPPLALMRSQQAATACKVMLVIGTSATVQPAATMPIIAKQAGARIIELNEEETPLTGWVSDYRIPGKAGEVMARLVEKVEELLK
jgi:NAD-dependent deacetylase